MGDTATPQQIRARASCDGWPVCVAGLGSRGVLARRSREGSGRGRARSLRHDGYSCGAQKRSVESDANLQHLHNGAGNERGMVHEGAGVVFDVTAP